MNIWFPGAWPSLNEYINAERASRYKAAGLKKAYTDAAMYVASQYEPVHTPVAVKFTWHLKNGRKDPDNVAYAQKYIFDGLVAAGVLPNDGQKEVWRICHEFVRDVNEGVMVELKEAQ